MGKRTTHDLAQASARHIAAVLNQLFATRLSPDGTPYTLREVSEALEERVSVSYLSELRRGEVLSPSFDTIAALADFFGVDLASFAEGRPIVPAPTPAVRRALAAPLVPEIAVRASEVSVDQRAQEVLHLRALAAPPGRLTLSAQRRLAWRLQRLPRRSGRPR